MTAVRERVWRVVQATIESRENTNDNDDDEEFDDGEAVLFAAHTTPFQIKNDNHSRVVETQQSGLNLIAFEWLPL